MMSDQGNGGRRGVCEGRGGTVGLEGLLRARPRASGLRFGGVASSVAVDRQGERMTAGALAGMAEAQGLRLMDRHGERGQALGMVERCWVEDGKLRVEGRLEERHPRARRLHALLRAGGRRGLSVAGRVREVHQEVDPETGRRVRCVDRVELQHVAVCEVGEAQNPEAYVEVG